MTEPITPPVYQLHFETSAELYFAYMPFLTHGGLFIRTNEPLALGTQVQLRYQLPVQEKAQANETLATVVWVNPIGVSGGRPVGMGVQFTAADLEQKNQIEQLLSDQLNAPQLTATI